MFLDISRLEGDRLDARFEIDRESPLLEGFEAEVGEPLILDVQVRRFSGTTYVLTGRVCGAVVAPCRRCLDPSVIPIDVPLRVVYQEKGRDAKRDEDPGDDDIVWLERGAQRIELYDQIRDQLIPETERFPLCILDCRGICPQCGQDLNEGSCDCALEPADSRWRALEGLRLGEESD